MLVVCHGSPFVSGEVLAEAPNLTLLGELEGDRFAHRLDVAAAYARGVRVVDTSNGSSWPTAEWALGLALIGRRNAGALFRRMIAHESTLSACRRAVRARLRRRRADRETRRHDRLRSHRAAPRRAVASVRVEIHVFDPYAARELAEQYGVAFAPLATVLESDVVFVLVPETSTTVGMLGEAELTLLRPGTVLVNVARGKVIDAAGCSTACGRATSIACLDVFDPEPVPLDSPLVDLPNVFLHAAHRRRH